jgi:hypothetical protein
MLELCDVALSVIHVCMIAHCVLLFFSAIEMNEDCAEEGKVFEYQEEGDQGKPTKASHLLVAYLNPTKSLCIVLLLFHYYALFSILLLFPI